jgi:dihydroflavonol-4-reductase
MTVVVTGASGHIGGNLVRALLDRGRPVRALVHQDRRALQGLQAEIVQGDVRDPASLRHAFKGAQVVYHTAAHVSIATDEWPLLHAINVVGTRNVVEACLHCGVRRLIHFSSIHALQQEPLDAPVDESRPLAEAIDDAPYDRSKAAAEQEVRRGIAQGLDAVVLNPTAILGPHDYRPSHMGQVLLALGSGQLPALVPGGFDWVDVRDVVKGAMRAEERAPGGARYILSGHWASVRDLAAMVESITGVRAPWLVCPLFLAYLGVPLATATACLSGQRPLFTRVALDTLQGNRQIRHARAAGELGYHPRPLQETLVDSLRWFAEAGLLARPLARRTVGAL